MAHRVTHPVEAPASELEWHVRVEGPFPATAPVPAPVREHLRTGTVVATGVCLGAPGAAVVRVVRRQVRVSVTFPPGAEAPTAVDVRIVGESIEAGPPFAPATRAQWESNRKTFGGSLKVEGER